MRDLFALAEKAGYTSSEFIENIEKAFANSQYTLFHKALEKDTAYQEAQRQYGLLFQEIQNKLGEEENLMLKLEDLRNQLGSSEEDLIYLQGFLDCTALLKQIKII